MTMHRKGVLRMKKLINLIAIAVILASIVGCKKEKTGGGSRSIVAGTTARASVYGISAGMKLGFVMFTDIPSDGANVSAGSTWTGHIEPTKGLAVNYEGSTDELKINGIEHEFAGGRIFLVSTTGDTLSIEQLNVPIGDAPYDAEIDRIVMLKEVQAFLIK
jgi:hypothetical protein